MLISGPHLRPIVSDKQGWDLGSFSSAPEFLNGSCDFVVSVVRHMNNGSSLGQVVASG